MNKLLFVLLVIFGGMRVEGQALGPDSIKIRTSVLNPYSSLDFDEIDEASGIVKSRSWENVFWLHNDSGDEARIFAVTRLGDIIKPDWAGDDYRGLLIPDAVNVDWEDIAVDDAGNIYIGDFGNNENVRTDLLIYVIREPFPKEFDRTAVFKKIHFYFPEQKNYPPDKRNFDCEALFWKDGKLYLLTKHRSDKNTSLYRLDNTELFTNNAAVLLGEFAIGDRVTAADCSADGKSLAVLTRSAVWLFQTDDEDNFFQGKISFLPIEAGQCEGICFDNDELIIINEEGDLFQIHMSELKTIQ